MARVKDGYWLDGRGRIAHRLVRDGGCVCVKGTPAKQCHEHPKNGGTGEGMAARKKAKKPKWVTPEEAIKRAYRVIFLAQRWARHAETLAVLVSPSHHLLRAVQRLEEFREIWRSMSHKEVEAFIKAMMKASLQSLPTPNSQLSTPQ